jgi:hypothetical protein
MHVDDGRGVSALAIVGLDDAGDDVALDELALLLGGLAERRGGKAVDVPHGTEGGLVEQADRLGGKQLALAAGALQTEAKVLGGVLGDERLDLEAVMDARVQRAVAPQGKAVAELGQADEDEREQRAAVPLVVEQDVEVVEGVLVQEVGLVEEEAISWRRRRTRSPGTRRHRRPRTMPPATRWPTTRLPTGSGTSSIVYRSKDGHLWAIYWTGNGVPTCIDLNAYAAAPLAADKPTAFVDVPKTHVMYRGKDHQIHEIWWSSPGLLHQPPDPGGALEPMVEDVQPVDPGLLDALRRRGRPHPR